MSDEETITLPETIKLAGFAEARPRLDGRAFAFRIDRVDGVKLDLWCDAEQLKDIIAFALGLFQAAHE